ncbi:MAG: prolyl oligopeptidase family serine peptidase, partial [Cyclobacteriaceae bacterium]
FCSDRIYAQQSVKKIVTEMKYLLYVPSDEPDKEGYPLMLFLHGSGERGTDIEKVKAHGPPSFLGDTMAFPFVVVSPQCPPGQWWDTQTLLDILDEVEAQLPIDKNRVYVTGLSMGGYGTWALLKEAPDRFAAAAPVCGGGDPSAACRFRDVPVWAFHGAKDDVVLLEESEKMVQELKQLDGDVQFTLYPDADHNSWTVTYDNPELYRWFLSHTLRRTDEPRKRELKACEGVYRADDGEELLVSRNDDQLYLTAPQRNWEYELTGMSEFTYAFPGRRSHEPQRRLYFHNEGRRRVDELQLGPCENKVFKKVK